MADITKNHSQVSAFVLHSKAYLENSQIFQLFSYELGRFSVIAKGIKGKRSQARKAILQPFSPLKIEFTGKSDLKTLIRCDINQKKDEFLAKPNTNLSLQGKALACGYYANELLLRACPERHEYPELFMHYSEFIHQLKSNDYNERKAIQPMLRNFEVALLTNIGIAPDCLFDTEQNEIIANEQYYLIPECGFQSQKTLTPNSNEATDSDRLCKESTGDYYIEPKQNIKGTQYESYQGQAILSLANGTHYPEHYKSSQQIMSKFLQEVIGKKPLQSRKLWQHLNLSDNRLSLDSCSK